MVQYLEEVPLSSFSFWEMSLPDIPPRSYLYGLVPCGINSLFVESLTSYICRLAYEHHVEIGILIRHIVAPVISKRYIANGQSRSVSSFLRYATPINGNGVMASDWSRALASLTGRSDLSQLTLFAGTDALSERSLLRPDKQWCSMCYDEWRHQGVTIYEPLLWSINQVTVCPKHKQLLERCCPHCFSRLPWLTWRSRLGYCSSCGRWLGSSKVNSQFGENDLYIAETVGCFLSYTSQLSLPIPRGDFVQSLQVLVSATTEGNVAAFSRRLGLPKTSLWELVQGHFPPSLPFLLQLSLQFRLPLLHLFTGVESGVSEASTASQGKKQVSRHLFQYEKVQQALKDVLADQDNVSLSMREVARQLGYPLRTIATHFPGEARSISQRYLDYRKQQGLLRKKRLEQRITEAVNAVSAQGQMPTFQQVGALLSTPGCFREFEARQALFEARQKISSD